MSFDPQPPQPGPDKGWNTPSDQGWSNPAPAPDQGWSNPAPPAPAGQGQGQYAVQPVPQAQPWQPMPAQGHGMHQPMVQPKNAALCVIVSFFIPGLGSIIAGNTGTGVLILVLDVVAWILSIFLIGIPFAIGIWIWGMVDAYKSAQKWNAAHGIIS